MSTHKLIKLIPKAPFHFGEIKDMEKSNIIIHSDTIFSALCRISDRCLSKDHYNEFIKPFIHGQPNFLLSSAFPYYESNEDMILFFPKPLIFKDFVEKYPRNIKNYKKIQYISKRIFNAFLTNNNNYLEKQFQNQDGSIKKENLIQGGNVWISSEEKKKNPTLENLWKVQREPRIVINRETKETGIYHYTRIYFNENVGLYIMLHVNDTENEEGILSHLFKLFRYLGDSGIGGERSTGSGLFKLGLDDNNTPFKIDLKEPINNSSQWITVSLLLPKESEVKDGLLNPPAFYSLENRKGWISNSTYLRKSVYMIVEGSVLNNFKGIIGKVEDLTPDIIMNQTPDYKIHRYGFAYPIKIV